MTDHAMACNTKAFYIGTRQTVPEPEGLGLLHLEYCYSKLWQSASRADARSTPRD